jgi:hypothetical protein
MAKFEAKYHYNTDVLREDSEFKWYFMGFVAADGNLNRKESRLEITINEKDRILLEVFRDRIVPDKPIYERPKTNAVRFSITNKEIVDYIIDEIGIPERKSLTLSFPNTYDPQEYDHFPINARVDGNILPGYVHHFMRGYFDGDGTWGVKKAKRNVDGNMRHYYGLRMRVLGTDRFLRTYSIRFDDSSRTPYNRGGFYSLEMNFSKAEEFADFIYNDATIFLQRKYDVMNLIRSSDSSQLASNYGTLSGCYNTPASQ